MNKKGTGYLTWCILLLALTVGVGVTSSVDFDLQGFKDKLEFQHIDLNVTSSPDLGNALESAVNGGMDALFHFLKWVAEWATQNPEVPFKLIIICVIFAIAAPIMLTLFKFSFILFILIKEWNQKRKDKKELNEISMRR